ncbi:MAG: response regulator [Burkholderiales bacterium]
MTSNNNRPLVAIVDDDRRVAKAVTRLLNSHAIDTLQFQSPQEFVDLVETTPSFRPDCVILDVQMPGLTGLAVQRHLALRRPEIRIVFLSAGHKAGVGERALAAGAAAFIHKPFDVDHFVWTIYDVLGLDALS